MGIFPQRTFRPMFAMSSFSDFAAGRARDNVSDGDVRGVVGGASAPQGDPTQKPGFVLDHADLGAQREVDARRIAATQM